jgi:hypothetical protein
MRGKCYCREALQLLTPTGSHITNLYSSGDSPVTALVPNQGSPGRPASESEDWEMGMSTNLPEPPVSNQRRRGDLLRAKQHMDESERLIERQKRLVAKLYNEGWPTGRALKVLSKLESGCLQRRDCFELLKTRIWREDELPLSHSVLLNE